MSMSPRDAGEIPLLDADRLDDHANAVARGNGAASFGDVDDDRALGRLIEKLKGTSVAASKSDEDLQDMAIDLYNKMCDPIRTGRATDEQIARAAQIFGESPDHLSERLAPKKAEPGAGGGASALLQALQG